MSASPSTQQPLSTLDPNSTSNQMSSSENNHVDGSTTDAPNHAGENNGPKSMEYHRQVLASKLSEGAGKQPYISPSDTIMSPCTQKLSNYRNKHFMKAKPQSLFAKTSAKNRSMGAGEEGSQTSTETEGSVEGGSQ
ncbi:MAG: hypothetical protein M1817_006437 [Caeruleum heppii]|nr:MAG: hypothetical protein M1817_006437 [Caeruleum heppii]